VLVAGGHVLALPSRPARATQAGGPVLVLVYLEGGNDFLNTVIPLDARQRALYERLRPDLAIPRGLLRATEIDRDPVGATRLALHPSCAPLSRLYAQGRLAVVLGAGLSGSSLSHFEAEKAWFEGRDRGIDARTGWLGRHLDDRGIDLESRAVSFGPEVSPALSGRSGEALGLSGDDPFEWPDDPRAWYRDGATRQATLAAILEGSPSDGSMLARAGQAGSSALRSVEQLGRVSTRDWGSRNVDDESELAVALRHVASILRHDRQNPGERLGLGFFHVRQPGFDTHSNQGSLSDREHPTHPALLEELSGALHAFQQDLDAIGEAERVVTVVYSEFGRRPAQNGPGPSAGTDHGTAGGMFLMGSRVAGGVHGSLPALDRLDVEGNLHVTTDFRHVYAAIIDDWLGGDHTRVLPEGPFRPLPLIR
jgi:uncharacterized protein (DUF1501 family)